MDDATRRELEALRMRVDVLERVIERMFGDKPTRYLGPRKKEPTLPVKCPDCGAEPGERCVTQQNRPTGFHLERVREHARSVLSSSPRQAGR